MGEDENWEPNCAEPAPATRLREFFSARSHLAISRPLDPAKRGLSGVENELEEGAGFRER